MSDVKWYKQFIAKLWRKNSYAAAVSEIHNRDEGICPISYFLPSTSANVYYNSYGYLCYPLSNLFLKFLASVTFCIELYSSAPPVTPAAMAVSFTTAYCTSKMLLCCATRLRAINRRAISEFELIAQRAFGTESPPSLNFVLSREPASCTPQEQRGGQSSLQTANPNINS